MPRTNLPPTPQPSTDITGKNGANAPQLETSFNLPPAALGGRGSVASSSGPSETASDSSYRPPSPSSPVATSKSSHARKRSSTTAQQSVITKDDYSLPPPPTRSRKIIQMKPKDTQEPPKTESQTQSAKPTTAATSGTKRKQAGNNTAAGRKIARKTAHSLIERRRRSKMNEEFGVLKDMIPACRGQEMHKLAILQASIEYMRYLEQCVSDLKTANSRRLSPASAASELPPPPTRRMRDDDEEDGEQDEEMEDAVSPTYVEQPPPKTRYAFANASPAMYPSDRSVYAHSTTTSPAIMPHDHNGQYSANPSPALRPSDPHHYSLAPSSTHSTVTSPSIHPSPAFSAHTPSATHFSNPFHNGPASTGPVAAPGSSHGGAHFSLTSPALKPQADREDQEATEALMMLNTDRRSWSSARGMSVKDLLSG
ncbi:helix-loop-helix dna-binding domain-containing protein [Stemphylium lycopersici]|uniref:Helix-loop-helix dna-binding domain-containing protein n=1 Tax=Stemphylium lycopersici TaxID=183478 RepID=A0A364N0E2_STELY|nr:helix-loop-helix dna-binding domain-containing protein [Stemphylium lycopersici]RAR08452.1 helix-loop-helix dna-binding domain-containing protein [Stemphylium lycopersici]RAR11299.1 helix-loop-helix dna-binding domain-containing protein [Stemphylium lycopersici]